MERTTERIRFRGSSGEYLVGRLERPAAEPLAYALFAHCFTCSKDLKAIGRISRTLADRGFAVFRFDFTGIGESEGDFADTNFSSNVEDLKAAADFLRREYRAPRLLVGHSLGGAAVLTAAPQVPECTAVATIAAPSTTHSLRGILLDSAPEIEATGLGKITLGGRTFTVKKQFLDDLAQEHVQANVPRLEKALIIFHSPADRVVEIEHARRLFEAARHPKSFISLGNADHLLSDVRDARFVGEILSVWAAHYIQERDAYTARPGLL